MSFGIPVRNGLAIGLLSSTMLSSRAGMSAALMLNFLTGSLDPRITFSRGSQATLTDSTGKITYAPNNLLTNSENFEASAWSKTAVGAGATPTVTANAGVAPDGTTTADRVQFNCVDASAVGNRSLISQSLSQPAGVRYVGSVWVKAFDAGNVGKTVRLAVDAFGSNVFTLTADWQRISINGLASTTVVNFVIETRGTFTTQTADVLLWGAQLEQVTYQTTPGTYNSTTPKNLLGYTQEFDNAAWPKQNATVTANAIVAPDGTTTADKLVEDATNTSHRMYQTAAAAFTNGTTVTNSVYFKAAERTWGYVRLELNDNTSLLAWFNLSTGALGTVQSGLTASITSAGNGWYRCSITGSVGTGATPAKNYFLVGCATGDGIQTYAGTAGSGIYVWGAQLSNSASLDPYVYNPGAAPTGAAYYGPRFDYDPVTLAAKGLLIEEQRTNLLTYSEQFDNAAWTKENATVTANAATSPDGTTTADKFTPSVVSINHDMYNTTAATITNGALVTASVYVKAAGYGFATVNLVTNLARQVVVVNLSTGAITQNSSFGSPTNVTYSATSVGNGWYRVTVSFTSTGTTGYLVTGCNPTGTATLDVNLNPVFAGDGTSGIYIWGAQLEAGAFATSYIPTVASQVTRSADIATMVGANFSNWYNQNEGTFVVVADSASPSSVNPSLFSADDGTTSNAILSYALSGNLLRAQVRKGGSSIGTADTGGFSNTSIIKAAIGYNSTTIAISSSGVAVVSGALSSAPNPATRLAIGVTPVTPYINGHIRSITYYNYRMPNALLQRITI